MSDHLKYPSRVALAALLLLVGCEAPSAFAERRCGSEGLTAGTPAFQQCVSREVDQMRRDNDRLQQQRVSIPSVY